MWNWMWRRGTTLLVVLMLWIVGMQAPAASAIGAGCRTDPKFFFGNGDKLTIVASVGVAKEQIQKIRYVVHAPADQENDQAAVKIVYTGLRPGVEKAEVKFDLEEYLLTNMIVEPYAYYAEAIVITDAPDVPVAMDMALKHQDPTVETGTSGEWLRWGVTR